jgi:hypothetical protein
LLRPGGCTEGEGGVLGSFWPTRQRGLVSRTLSLAVTLKNRLPVTRLQLFYHKPGPRTFRYSLKINPAGGATLFCGGRKVRCVPCGPGEKPETIFRRLLRDKTLAGMDRLAVMRIVGDTELLKNKSGFVIV